MLTNKHYINLISILFLILINVPVILSYSVESNGIIALNSLLFILMLGVILFFIDRKFNDPSPLRLNKYHYTFGLVIPLLLFIIIKFIPHSINSQNYNTNVVWIQNYQMGVYPYNFTEFTYNLPVIYYLLSPFYQFGDLGYFTLLGLLVLSLIILFDSKSKKELFSRFSVIIFLPLIYSQLFSKSDLLANAVIFIGIIYLIKRYVSEDKINFRFLIIGMVLGLILCTRLLFTIPFLLLLLYFFRNNLKNLFLFLFISLFIYIMFVFPFMNLDSRLFWLYGPYTNSLASLPVWVYAVILIVVLYIGWMLSDFRELLFASGILMSIIAFAFSGKGELLNNLILAFPFFVLSLNESRIDRFRGKYIELER